VDPEIPDDALIGVLVDLSELRLAQSTSVARVLARLGSRTGQFPFPATSDRDRPRVAVPGDETSILSQVARISVPMMSAVWTSRGLELRCWPKARSFLAEVFEQLPADAAFALMTSRDPGANGQLVWFPGQLRPSAITPGQTAGDVLTGSMVIVAPGVEHDELTIQEDGIAVLIQQHHWDTLRRALLAGDELDLSGFAGERSLRIRQLAEGYTLYVPEGGANGDAEIVLRTADAELRAAVSVDALSAYIEGLLAVLAPLQAFAIQIHLVPSSGPNMATRSDLPPDVMSALYAVEHPIVRGPVVVEILKL
jgi:hypothetical protein